MSSAFGMCHVEKVTARIGDRRMKCRLIDAPIAEDEAPTQDEAAQERWSVFDCRPPEMQS